MEECLSYRGRGLRRIKRNLSCMEHQKIGEIVEEASRRKKEVNKRLVTKEKEGDEVRKMNNESIS